MRCGGEPALRALGGARGGRRPDSLSTLLFIRGSLGPVFTTGTFLSKSMSSATMCSALAATLACEANVKICGSRSKDIVASWIGEYCVATRAAAHICPLISDILGEAACYFKPSQKRKQPPCQCGRRAAAAGLSCDTQTLLPCSTKK